MVFTLPGAQIWSQLASDDDELAALAGSFQEAYDRYADGVCAFAGVTEMVERLRAAPRGSVRPGETATGRVA